MMHQNVMFHLSFGEIQGHSKEVAYNRKKCLDKHFIITVED